MSRQILTLQALSYKTDILPLVLNVSRCRDTLFEVSKKLFLRMFFLNPLTAGAAYIRVLIFYWHIKYRILNMLKIKCDINQQGLKRVNLHFVKSE